MSREDATLFLQAGMMKEKLQAVGRLVQNF